MIKTFAVFLHRSCIVRTNCGQSEVKHVLAIKVVVAMFNIKELVHAFSCVYIELWMHSGIKFGEHRKLVGEHSEARVALGCASSNS